MYLDPGTGSVILQVLIAGLLGAGVFLRMFSKKIKAFFSKGEPETMVEDEQKEA